MTSAINVHTSIDTSSLVGAESEWAEAALNGGSSATGRWESCTMTRAQQAAIFAVGLHRGQGMLPLPGVRAGTAVWCHAQIVAEHHQITPSVYWTRQGDGSWCYESCTNNTHAKVAMDGRLTGQTLSTLARAAGCEVWTKGESPVPDAVMNVSSDVLLSAAYEAALAAMEAVSEAQVAYAARSVTIAAVCEAQDAMRKAAAFALAMGASEWIPWHGK